MREQQDAEETDTTSDVLEMSFAAVIHGFIPTSLSVRIKDILK